MSACAHFNRTNGVHHITERASSVHENCGDFDQIRFLCFFSLCCFFWWSRVRVRDEERENWWQWRVFTRENKRGKWTVKLLFNFNDRHIIDRWKLCRKMWNGILTYGTLHWQINRRWKKQLTHECIQNEWKTLLVSHFNYGKIFDLSKWHFIIEPLILYQ